jgi:hypothetical protein
VGTTLEEWNNRPSHAPTSHVLPLCRLRTLPYAPHISEAPHCRVSSACETPLKYLIQAMFTLHSAALAANRHRCSLLAGVPTSLSRPRAFRGPLCR